MHAYQAVWYVRHTSIKYFLKRKRIVSLRGSTRIIKDLLKVRLEKITFPMIFLYINTQELIGCGVKDLLQMSSGLPCPTIPLDGGDTILSPAFYLREFTVITDNIFLQSRCSDVINNLDMQSAIMITTRSISVRYCEHPLTPCLSCMHLGIGRTHLGSNEYFLGVTSGPLSFDSVQFSSSVMSDSL